MYGSISYFVQYRKIENAFPIVLAAPDDLWILFDNIYRFDIICMHTISH